MKQSKSDRTRAFIIERTAGIFNVKGYAGTSLTDLTEATKLTKGSIYGNFENKEEVAIAAFDHNLQTVNNIINGEIAKQEKWKDKLLVYVEVYEHFLKHPFPDGGCPILNTAIEADDTHPGLKKKAADALQAWKARIINIIEKGMAAGEFKEGTDSETLALTIIATIEGLIMVTKATGKVNYISKVMRQVEKMMLNIVA